MAYLVRRPGGSVQIRESVRTERGPRSRTLAAFRGALDDRTLDAAAAKARRPFDRAGLIAKARALGLAYASTVNTAARRLVREIHVGQRVDENLAALLRDHLSESESIDRNLVVDLEEVAEWLESSDEERGATLRGLLRLGDAIVRARGTPAPRTDDAYPRIHSTPARGA